jgi:hypothetical protein
MEKLMDYGRLTIPALLLSSLTLSGCGLIAAGTAGAVAADEIQEDDGRFDPLENTEAGEKVYDEVYE